MTGNDDDDFRPPARSDTTSTIGSTASTSTSNTPKANSSAPPTAQSRGSGMFNPSDGTHYTSEQSDALAKASGYIIATAESAFSAVSGKVGQMTDQALTRAASRPGTIGTQAKLLQQHWQKKD